MPSQPPSPFHRKHVSFILFISYIAPRQRRMKIKGCKIMRTAYSDPKSSGAPSPPISSGKLKRLTIQWLDSRLNQHQCTHVSLPSSLWQIDGKPPATRTAEGMLNSKGFAVYIPRVYIGIAKGSPWEVSS